MIWLPLSAPRVQVVAPHPDDETIAAWALMRRLAARGARIDVLVVTDGAASHPGSRSWPPARLVAERRRETRRAMATLAIPPSRIRFLSFPDAKLDECGARLDRALRRLPPCDLLVGPVQSDAHPDHQAVAAALARMPRRGERRLGYRVWPENAGLSGRSLQVSLNGLDICRKRRLMRSYRTQTGRIVDATAGFSMTHRHLHAFVRPTERFEVFT